MLLCVIDKGDNDEADSDTDAEAEATQDDVPTFDNPVQVEEPNVVEYDNNKSGVESNNKDESSNVESDTSYYFENNETQNMSNNESTSSDNANTPTSLKSELYGPHWVMNLDRIRR